MPPASGAWPPPVLFALILLLALGCAPAAASALPAQDLAAVASRASLLGSMLVLEETADAPLRPAQALAAEGWVADSRAGLAAPRRQTTIWLQAMVHNSSAVPVTRWLEVAPWRLNDVQLFVLQPGATVPLAAHQRGGLVVPVDQREIRSARTLFPVTLAAGETRQLLLRLHSDSRPYVAVELWEPLFFLEQETGARVLHGALLACVLTLLVVLVLRMDGRFFLLGAWITVAYVFEAEKEGYITQFVLSAWAEYGVFMRTAAGILSFLLFLLSSLLILESWQQPRCRRTGLWLTGAALAAVACLPFVEPNTARRLAALVGVTILAVWPLTLLALRLKGQPWRQALLLLFALNWGESLSFIVVYVLNIGYTGQFAASAVVVRIGTILGIVGLFACQEKRREQARQRASLEGERERSARLEAAVAARTDELRKALLEANEANRAKTEFFARVSHDLRSPLTSIIGYAQLLQAEGGKTGHKVSIILRSAGHMLNLVNDLIEYARGASSDRLEITPVYIHALLDALALEAKVLAQKKGNRFRLEICDEPPPVLRVDGKRLHQVLLNLLDNAAKFTEGGTIELQVSCRTPPGDSGRVWLGLRVRDDGCGIALPDQARVFEPFFRADGQAWKGWGLGLAIVEEWIKRMDGELRLNSVPGVGTEVCIWLPLEIGREGEMDLPQLVDASPVLPALQGGGRHVWVVEDVAEIRELLVEEFGGAGFAVHSAADGRAFIEQMRRPGSVRPALVLTDDLMPHADGSAVLAAVREHWPGVPVMLLSATRKAMHSLDTGAGDGFDASLVKPVNLGVLRGTVAQLLELPSPPAAAGPSADDAQGAAALVLPTPQALARFDELVRMGALTDLGDWAAALCREEPACRAFALRVMELAEAGDLEAIERLHAAHEAQARVP